MYIIRPATTALDCNWIMQKQSELFKELLNFVFGQKP